MLDAAKPGHDFGRELIPTRSACLRVKPYLFRGLLGRRRNDRRSFYQANIMLGRLDSPFHFWDRGAADLHAPRHLPGSLMPGTSR